MSARFFQNLWPRKENDETLNPKNIFDEYSQSCKLIEDDKNANLGSRILELSKYLFEDEENRRNRIESNASSFLNTIAVVAALIVGMAGFILKRGINFSELYSVFTLILYFISLIYLFCAYISTLSIFSEIHRYYLGPTDLVPKNSETENQFSLRLGEKFLSYTIENYKVNNRVLNKIHTSRILIRNSIVALLIAGLLIGFSSMTIDKPVQQKTNISNNK